jgi:DNA polymerase-3 subunit epsilon
LRQIVLDTETTGLEPGEGHRIIEIGAIELVNRRPTGVHFHEYLNPEREIDAGAAKVHGMRLADLAGKPRFGEVAERLLAFLEGAELVIHNAPFDLAFLDAELTRWARAGGQLTTIRSRCRVLDTLALAREMHPGQRNGLDALCKRYTIDNSHRTLHGALLDARILADVYLAMTGGQSALALDQAVQAGSAAQAAAAAMQLAAAGQPLRVVTASSDEMAAHEAFMQKVHKASGGKSLWQ